MLRYAFPSVALKHGSSRWLMPPVCTDLGFSKYKNNWFGLTILWRDPSVQLQSWQGWVMDLNYQAFKVTSLMVCFGVCYLINFIFVILDQEIFYFLLKDNKIKYCNSK